MSDARHYNQTGDFNNAPPTPPDYEESTGGIDSDIYLASFELK